jgi:LEA14-like dessication related protein
MAVVLVVALAALAAGTYLAAEAGTFEAADPDEPRFEVVDAEWSTDDRETVGVVTTVRAENPNSFAIEDVSLDYRMSLNGVTVAAGNRTGIGLPPGETTIALPARIDDDRLADWWVAHVRANETLTYRVSVDARVDAAGLTFERNRSIDGRLFEEQRPVLAAVSAAAARTEGRYARTFEALGLSATVGYELVGTDAEWGRVSRDRTVLRVRYTVRNAGDVAVPAVADGLNLTVETEAGRLFRTTDPGIDPGDAGGSLLDEGETRTVTVRLALDNDRIDEWFLGHVRRGERSRLTASVGLRFRLPASTPGLSEPVAVTVPPGGLAVAVCRIRTAVLVDREPSVDCTRPSAP